MSHIPQRKTILKCTQCKVLPSNIMCNRFKFVTVNSFQPSHHSHTVNFLHNVLFAIVFWNKQTIKLEIYGAKIVTSHIYWSWALERNNDIIYVLKNSSIPTIPIFVGPILIIKLPSGLYPVRSQRNDWYGDRFISVAFLPA